MKIYLQRELNVLKQIRHPNIVQFLGLSKTVEGLYLITEFVERGDLCRLLYDRAVTELDSWALRLRITIAAAQGLAYLHAKNLIHRDIKAANFLVAENWNVKLCDFGFSRSVASAKGMQAGNVMTLCVPADHELLTNKGFMDLDTFLARQRAGEPDLLVAGYLPDSQQLVFEAPLALKQFDVADHPLVEFGGADDANGVHTLATRDHDMFVQRVPATATKRGADGAMLETSSTPYAKVKAGTLHDSNLAVRHLAAAAAGVVAVPLAQADADVFAALQLESGDAQRLCFLEQYGFWLLSTAGVRATVAPALSGWLATQDNECMAPFVWSLNVASLRALVAGLRRADASLTTSSMRLRDDIVRVLLLAGFSPCFRSVGKSWAIECASADSAAARPATSGTRQVAFSGRVWCFKMPSGFVWARRVVKDAVSGGVCEASRALVLGNCGTDEWMAPETMMGLEYSNTADVFSFSVFLTETMFRAEPEQRSPGTGFRFDVPKFKAALTHLADYPPELVQIVLDGTTYDPVARPSMKKILQRLQSLAKTVQDVPLSASPPPAAAAVVVTAAVVAAAPPAAAPAAAAATTVSSGDNGTAAAVADAEVAQRLTKSKKKKEKHGDKHKDSKDKAKKKEKKEKDGGLTKESSSKDKDKDKDSERRHRH